MRYPWIGCFTTSISVQFHINRDHATTKTPRRNEDIEQALEFMERLCGWSRGVHQNYLCHLDVVLRGKHNPAGSESKPPATGSDLETTCSIPAIFVPSCRSSKTKQKQPCSVVKVSRYMKKPRRAIPCQCYLPPNLTLKERLHTNHRCRCCYPAKTCTSCSRNKSVHSTKQ